MVVGLRACDSLAQASRECRSTSSRAVSLARNSPVYVVETSSVDCLNRKFNVRLFLMQKANRGEAYAKC